MLLFQERGERILHLVATCQALNSLSTGGQFETISVLRCVTLMPLVVQPVNKGQVWFGLLEFNVSFVTVTDILRPCQPEKLMPWPGFDRSFLGHNDRRAIISEWTRLRLKPLSHRGWQYKGQVVCGGGLPVIYSLNIPWCLVGFLSGSQMIIRTGFGTCKKKKFPGS